MEIALFNNKQIAMNFAKIKMAKNGLISDSFMIIARIESLILENGMKDALERIKYREAGADGIMIHSRKKEPKEILNLRKNTEKLIIILH